MMGKWGAQDGILRLGSHKMPSAVRILWGHSERALINPTQLKTEGGAAAGETFVRRRRSVKDSPHIRRRIRGERRFQLFHTFYSFTPFYSDDACRH
jgi:hypothetical protein